MLTVSEQIPVHKPFQCCWFFFFNLKNFSWTLSPSFAEPFWYTVSPVGAFCTDRKESEHTWGTLLKATSFSSTFQIARREVGFSWLRARYQQHCRTRVDRWWTRTGTGLAPTCIHQAVFLLPRATGHSNVHFVSKKRRSSSLM